MATSQPNLALDNTTDATFRAWGSGISAALSAVGLVQTADTGQINWTTVTHPTTTAQSMGYEIWRFSDALQATRPVFIKIEYGAPSSAVMSGIWLTVGAATNGAGTITGGVVTTRTIAWQDSAVAAAFASPFFAFGDTSTVSAYATYSAGITTPWTLSFGFSIERSRNSDGTPNGDGLSVFIQQNKGNTNSSMVQYLSFTNSTVSTLTSTAFPVPAIPSRLSSFNTGNTVIVFPFTVVTPKPQSSPIGWLGCASSDFPRGMPVTISIYGAAHTYLALTGGGVNARALDQSAIGLLMRWE